MTSNWQEISFRIRHFSGKIDSSQMRRAEGAYPI